MIKRNLIFIIFLSIFAPATAFSSTLKCRVSDRFYDDNLQVTTMYYFHLNGNQGVIKMDGVYNDNGLKEVISREVRVAVESEKGLMTLESRQIIRFPVETISNEKMSHQFPDLFSQEGRTLSMTISPVDNGSYILSYNAKSIFYCKDASG